MTYRLNTADDFQTLKEAGQDRPLDPSSPEAKQLQERLDQITSANLSGIARQLYRARLALFNPQSAA